MIKKLTPTGIAVPFQMTATEYPLSSQGVDTLRNSIYSILMTTPGERVFRPTFGSWLRRVVFSNVSDVALVQAQDTIVRAIEQWEPRVTITGVSFEVNGTKVNVYVSWRPSGNDVVETTTLTFEG